MRDYEVRRVRSNVEANFAWVSIWFRARPGKLEPLHFVCQQRDAMPAARSKFDTIYLERDDQAVACYGGAKSVRIEDGSIILHLNRGVRALGLRSSTTFTVPDRMPGWGKARRVSHTMAGYSAGDVIHID